MRAPSIAAENAEDLGKRLSENHLAKERKLVSEVNPDHILIADINPNRKRKAGVTPAFFCFVM